MIFGVLLILNLSNFIYAWIPFVLSGFTFTAFYLYPASEASSVQKKISQELPFATIHMAAISGSNIEPVKILKIISMSKEYKNIGFEIKKIIAQVDIYGYDLVTSLKNVAQKISNKRLSELFSGIATNIGTGGELKSYLEKKADNFLLDYKLERQKYSDLAGTFMDIYISILIAAPLVLMMMFIVMNVAGLGLGGLSLTTLLFFSILVIILVNILFLIVLNFKQPKV
jgi:flagellar protein FlaJ